MSLRDFASCLRSLGPTLSVRACLPFDLDQLRDPWRCSNRDHAPRTAPSSQPWTMCLVSHQSLFSVEYTSCTRRFTSSQQSRCKSHRRMEQSHAACISMTVEHCKSASANSVSLQLTGSTVVTCLNVVSSRQQQRQRGKPELSMTKSHCCDSNPRVHCYARQLVPFIARKNKLYKT